MNVYIMRHGETDWNTVRRLQGTTDIPLNENGIALAQRTARAVHESGVTFDAVFSSPLVRAKTTAALMNEFSHAPIVCDERITEFCFGEAEGVTLARIMEDARFSAIRNWFKNPGQYVAERGAESFEHFFARLDNFLETVRALEGTRQNVLVVCHGGVVRGLMARVRGAGAADFASVKIPNCGMNLVRLESGTFTVEYTARVFV